MKPLGLSAHRLAMDLHVPATRIAEIIHGRRATTADSAVRLGRYFKTTPRFWLNLQNAYDLELIEDETLAQIQSEVRPSALTHSYSWPSRRLAVVKFCPVHPQILPDYC